MDETIVDRLFDEFRDLIEVLDANKEISLHSTANDAFRKVLLLAAASHFEHRICEDLIEFAAEGSSKDKIIAQFVRNKAITRQYHTLFDWDAPNANRFFALFGDSFKEFMRTEVASTDGLKEGINAFLEIGRERNRLVHEDFGAFPLEKTTEEIYELYAVARSFVVAVPEKLRQFCGRTSEAQIP